MSTWLNKCWILMRGYNCGFYSNIEVSSWASADYEHIVSPYWKYFELHMESHNIQMLLFYGRCWLFTALILKFQRIIKDCIMFGPALGGINSNRPVWSTCTRRSVQECARKAVIHSWSLQTGNRIEELPEPTCCFPETQRESVRKREPVWNACVVTWA